MEKMQIIKPNFFNSYNSIDSLLKIKSRKSYKSQIFAHTFEFKNKEIFDEQKSKIYI